MTVPDLVELFIEPLETLGLRYFVTGGHFDISADAIDRAMLDPWLDDRDLRDSLIEAEQYEA